MLRTIIFIALVGITAHLLARMLNPYDDTDPPEGGRSGLRLYTDARTGCHYLAVGSLFISHSLRPRMDAQGRQVCDTPAQAPALPR